MRFPEMVRGEKDKKGNDGVEWEKIFNGESLI